MQVAQAEFHRQLRSLFAMLRTLLRQSAEGQLDVEDYVAHLEGRIGALARTHEMLMRAPEEGVDLHELVCGEFLSQAVAEERFSVDGADVRIAREAAVPVGLAVHELAVNAAMHGALARPGGTVAVSWNAQSHEGAEQWLCFRWTESGAALTSTGASKRGFGLELFERMLPYELNARTTYEFESDGARVEFLFPSAQTPPVWRFDVIDKK